MIELTDEGKRLEARAALANARRSLGVLHGQMDLNCPESDELARIITEIRVSLDQLATTRLATYR